MESTGVYWSPLFQILEAAGLEVCLVNARHCKNLPGRKTDVPDCQWLQHLHCVGLLRGSFRPADQVCAVRTILRHRDALVRGAGRCVSHLHKALTQMNVQLHHVVSDLTGVTGQAILEAILKGERDPQTLAALKDHRIKASRDTLAKSLRGDWRAEHLFTLKQTHALWQQHQTLIAGCDAQIQAMLRAFDARGYPLCRFIRQHGCDCIIVAPAQVPRQPGDRVKTDRRDADQLARLLRAGELTGLYVPDPQDEAVRDLIRARYQVSQQQHRARQQLKMFLLRQNIRHAGTKPWTAAPLRFLATVKLPFAEQQFVFQELVNVITEAGQRLERYEKEIASGVEGGRWPPVVQALMSLRGVALLTGATLVAELGDLHRFESAPQLMSYLGLCPGEHTSGAIRQQGGIPKMGNGLARQAMIEAAWNNRPPARISRTVLARQAGLPQAVTEAAWAAQTRLHQRYQHLTDVGRKKSQVAAAALGRELAGFVWAIGRMVQPHALEMQAGKGKAA